MTRKEANVILDHYNKLTLELEKNPTNNIILSQMLVVEQIILDLGLGWKDLYKKIQANIQKLNDYAQ